MKKLFFILSPLHIIVMNCLINDTDDVWVITTPSLKELIKIKSNIIVSNIPDIQNSLLFKLKYALKHRFFNRLISSNISFDNIYIPSDINLALQAIYSNIHYEKLIIFEEGGTLLYYLNRKQYFFKKLLLNTFRLLIGLKIRHHILSSKDINQAFLFFPEFYEKKFHFPIIDLSEKISDYISKNQLIELDYKDINPDFIFLSQPLTQDGYCKDNLELKILRSFIDENTFKKVVIKLHPRDNKERYIDLFPDVHFITSSTPYQLLHFSLNPMYIGSYFSSALFSVPSIKNGFTRYSIISFLESDEINNIINLYKKHFDDLIIK